jgi:hypothetical protein
MILIISRRRGEGRMEPVVRLFGPVDPEDIVIIWFGQTIGLKSGQAVCFLLR